MVVFSGWVTGLIGLSIIVFILYTYIIGHYWEYIPVYRISKVVFVISSSIIFIGQIKLWMIVFEVLSGQLNLKWPHVSTILLVVCYSFLLGLALVFAKKFGKNWLFRMNYAFNRVYGPYLTFAPHPESSMIVSYVGYDGDPQIIDNNHPKLSIIELPFTKNETKIVGLRRFLISELESDCSYSYQIGNNEKKFHFKTAPSDLAEQEINFLVIGDMHAGSGDNRALVNILKEKMLDYDFILNIGDLLSDSSMISHWKTYFGQFSEITSSIPFLHTPGNHDGFRKKGARLWRSYFPQAFPYPEDGGYSVLYYGKIAILSLDFYNSGNLYDDISIKQKEWVSEILDLINRNDKINGCFISIHHPPASTGECGFTPHLFNYIEEITRNYTKISGIFSGHCHFLQIFDMKIDERRVVPFVITGGGGTNIENSALKKYFPRPYFWKSKEICNTSDFVPRKFEKRLQNNDFVNNYHVYTIVTNEFLKIQIKDRKMVLEVIDWFGKTLFKREYIL